MHVKIAPGIVWKERAKPNRKVVIRHVDLFDPKKLYVFFRFEDDPENVGDSMYSIDRWLEMMVPVEPVPKPGYTWSVDTSEGDIPIIQHGD